MLEGTTDAGVAGRSRSLEKRLPVNAGTFGNFATRALGEKSSPLAVLCPLDVERVDVRGISFSDRSFGTTAPPRSEMVFRFSSPCFISLILATSKSITRSNTPSSTTNVRPLKPPLPVLVVFSSVYQTNPLGVPAWCSPCSWVREPPTFLKGLLSAQAYARLVRRSLTWLHPDSNSILSFPLEALAPLAPLGLC